MAWELIHISLIYYVLCFGCSLGLEIYFNDPNDGYFLKPVYHKKQLWDPLTRREDFIVTQPSEEYVLGVKSGSYEKEQVIPQDISSIYPNLDHVDKPIYHGTVFGRDVSAKVVTDNLSQKYPRLQVLIHSSPHKKNKEERRPPETGATDSSYIVDDGLCGHVFVQHDKEELSSICVLGPGDSACVNGITLPSAWWQDNLTVRVYYAFSQKGENQECASASNSIVPGRLFEKSVLSSRRFLANIVLSENTKEFQREREEDILIDVPTNAFDPGTVFEVPIKFDAGSDMQNLVMSARVRQGLMIIGAEAERDSPWLVHVDIDRNSKAATVMAYLKDPQNYKISNLVQDVFAWRLQVEPSISNVESGRVVWSIKYDKDGRGEKYFSSESQVVSKINLRSKGNEKLVTIVKVEEILNFAMLTGVTQTYPLRAYLVRDTDTLMDATGHAACHSKETDVLKVRPDCSYVYVNGSESRGSHNMTIITKSGQHTAFTTVRVWIPMNPLDIQISDAKLSRIRSWKVGSIKNKRRSRSKRVVDLGMLTHPSILLSKKYKNHYGKSCSLRFQQALVDVYVKFYIATSAGYDYFINRQAALKITHLLKNQMRVADSRIVSLEDSILQGQSPGLTEVQVTTTNGRVLAARIIRVGNDKVEIARLIVNLVTGISLDVYPSQDIPGAWSAKGHIYSKFQSKWQSGILDVHIEYSDGTRFPLDKVSDADFYLDMENRNQVLIKVVDNFVSNLSDIKVYAVSEGRAESIKASLKQGRSCPKKKIPTLSTGYVITEADFSQVNQVQSDRLFSDGHYGDNRASDRYENVYMPKKPQDLDKLVKQQQSQTDQNGKNKKLSQANPSQTLVVLNDLAKDLTKNNNQIRDSVSLNSQTMKEPLQSPNDSKLSPLEIGMYVLIAVFCVGISVFLINCIVFMVRHKKKRKVHKRSHKEPVYQAKDWVWIGRATLERSSVKTECSQSLMPAEDFNGNHTSHLRSTSSQSRSSSSRGNSANSSNRNSFVSTIKGSECSIRITANPLSEDTNSNSNRNSETASQSSPTVPEEKWDYEAMGLSLDQLADYFDNLKESSA